jgi:hypothetical protein
MLNAPAVEVVAGEEDFAPAGRAGKADVRADTGHGPLPAAAGMRFLQPDGIADLNGKVAVRRCAHQPISFETARR